MRAGTGLGRARPGLLLLALSVFAAVTTETLPVGLLPEIGRTFGTTESTTGLLVSVYAGIVAVLAVPLTLATARFPRKRLLLVVMGAYVLSNLLSAVAPTFAVLAIARALGGATHAVFFSVSIGYAARLVPPALMGRALALTSSGISAGLVLGVPSATAVGTAIGWRGAFVALALVMAAALVLIGLRLPPASGTDGEGGVAPDRRRRLVAASAANGLAYAGQFTLYTYVTVLLLGSGAAPVAVGPLLLVLGGSGLLGVSLAGPQLDRRFRATAVTAHLLVVAGMVAAGVAFPVLAAVVVAGAVWNGAFGPMASIFQTAAVRARAASPDVAGAWVVSSSNIGIAAGSALGGAVLQAGGIVPVAWTAALPVAAALVIVLVARRTFPARH